MTLNILVPLDVLEATHPALVTAHEFFPNATLHLLHVMTATVTTLAPSAHRLAHLGPALLQAEEERVQEARIAITLLGGGEVAASASPATEILARARHVDLIWMGKAHKGHLDRFFLGSIAEEVIRNSPVPVVTVSTSQELPPPPTALMKRVLILHDFSPATHVALEFVRHHLPDAQINLIHVVDPSALTTPIPTEIMPRGRVISTQYLEDRNNQWRAAAQERLNALGGGQVLEGNPAQVALNHAGQGYDLLVIGKSSKGTLDRLIFGATAQRLLHESPIPVLTVYPDWTRELA